MKLILRLEDQSASARIRLNISWLLNTPKRGKTDEWTYIAEKYMSDFKSELLFYTIQIDRTEIESSYSIGQTLTVFRVLS